jgi:FKBP-type peptidyl-prolyl cis-trans isomerase 2
MSPVADGLVVTLEYTVHLADGTLLDSTGGCGPVSVMIGAGQLFPALEEHIMGMVAGETRRISIPAADAYGEWRAELVRTMSRDRLPPDLDLEVGRAYRLKSPDGKTLRFRLLEVGDTEVRADFNLPQAGQDLRAAVTVVAVRAPTAEEERRGRV